MGGNALAGLRHTRRFNADEYNLLVPDVIAKVKSIVGPDNAVAVLPAFRGKETFGDMDVLVALTSGSAYDFRQALASAFDVDLLVSDGTLVNQLDAPADAEVAVRTADDLARSGKTYSFAYRELQVDILPTTPDVFQSTLDYYSHNDCGNLMGGIVHAFGMKLGHRGLLYQFYDGTHQFAELVVERDWRKILPAFGWSYEVWSQGFDTLDEMYRFVVSSPYFNKDLFQLHNRNHKNRVRDRKRSTYNGFLAWLDEQPAGSLPVFEFDAAAGAHLPLLFELLAPSGFREQYDAAAKSLADWHLARSRFNGQVVQAITGLTDKALGELMTVVRAALGATPEAVQTRVLSLTDAQLAAVVRDQQRLSSEQHAESCR